MTKLLTTDPVALGTVIECGVAAASDVASGNYVSALINVVNCVLNVVATS